jgi:hypothetical protein
MILFLVKRLLDRDRFKISLFGQDGGFFSDPFKFCTSLISRKKEEEGDINIKLFEEEKKEDVKKAKGSESRDSESGTEKKEEREKEQASRDKEPGAAEQVGGGVKSGLGFGGEKKAEVSRRGLFKKGHIPWNKGKRGYKIKRSKKRRKPRFRLFKRGKLGESKNLKIKKKKTLKIKLGVKNALKKKKEEKQKVVNETFKISDLTEVAERLKDKEFVSILAYLGERGYQIKKEILNKEFNSNEELYEFLKEDLLNFLRSEYGALKEKVSLIRRKGKDVEYEWLKLMMIPSKINIFKSTLKRKDFNKVINLIEDLERKLKKYDELFEKKVSPKKPSKEANKPSLSKDK